MASALILPFDRIREDDLPLVGGKGKNLGQMTRNALPVPPGFCVTTHAYRHFLEASGQSEAIFSALATLHAGDLAQTRVIGKEVRDRLCSAPIPPEVADAVLEAWRNLGETHAYAVRSSATAEDLPHASFAGQQDTYLNVVGKEALLESVRAAWASLFTDRAILYRLEQGFSHRDVALAVVVQRMIRPNTSGILFTADPVNGHRHIASIDAGFGLGEALVSGLVTADLIRVDKRDGRILEYKPGDKAIRIVGEPGGGTRKEPVPEAERKIHALDDAQVRELVRLGSRVEAHFGCPQDIEWCIEENHVYLVQSRPITSLFPLPEPPPSDEGLHVYASFGHAQVMTDPMSPMALSMWRWIFPFGRSSDGESPNPLLKTAAGRLYLDPTPLLRRSFVRRRLPRLLANADRLMAEAVLEVAERERFAAGSKLARADLRKVARFVLPLLTRAASELFFQRPEGSTERVWQILAPLVEELRQGLAAKKPAAERIRLVRERIGHLLPFAFPRVMPILMAGMLSRVILEALTRGEAKRGDLDALVRGFSGNVTTEMDLAVGDLADILRDTPELAMRLQKDHRALEEVLAMPGGEDFAKAWNDFLARYGMRGPGEIDIARPRYQDDPSALVMAIVGNLAHEEKSAHRARHRRLIDEGEAAGERLVEAAKRGAVGFVKARLAARMVRVARNLLPVREHPKFLLISVLDEARRALLEAGDLLVREERLGSREDVWFLELDELIEALEDPSMELETRIAERKADWDHFARLSPPRVMTSEGEIVKVSHTREGMPEGALVGTAVSAGVVEGVARVVLNPTSEVLHAGEILIAPFTDPGWTPLFINAKGLVMEVGGLMTHGSVVAREYGIPAVVSVPDATTRIRSGQRIRVNGDEGYVELFEE